MAKRHKYNITRHEIIQMGTKMFLEKGYSHTSCKALADELELSTGNITFYFPTKEHLLAVLVEMLCEFQWKKMEKEVEDGKSSLMALCLELTAIAAICEESEIVKDFYLSAYSHPLTLSIIRKNDIEKAKSVFGQFCPDRTDEEFAESEILVSGIEYATLMTTDEATSLDLRIAGALHSIMLIYNVPEELRELKIKKVLDMDYRAIGRSIFKEFLTYIDEVTEMALEEAKI